MEAPRHYRLLFKGYHKIPSNNMASSHKRNILWRVMRVVALRAKKSETIKALNAVLHRKKLKSIDLDKESRLINDGIELHGTKTIDQVIPKDENQSLNHLQNSTTLKLYVKISPKNKSIIVQAKTFHIIHDIKAKIHSTEEIKPSEYTLFHNGKMLEDYRTLGSLGVRTESTLHLILNPRTLLPISVVTPMGKVLRLEANILFTVRDVKTLVESLVGCPVSDCKMIYAQNELEDCKSLAFYGVEEDAVLELQSCWIQIFVRIWSGKTVSLYVQKSSTVRDVKEKLFCKVGMPILRQNIVFSGKRLEDSRELSSYNVHKDSTLHMILSF